MAEEGSAWSWVTDVLVFIHLRARFPRIRLGSMEDRWRASLRMYVRTCTYVHGKRGTSSSSCGGRGWYTYARSCFRAPRRNISLAVGPLEGMQGDRGRVRRNTLMNRPRRRYRRSTDTMAATVVARISGDRRREKRKSIGRQVRRARLQGLDDPVTESRSPTYRRGWEKATRWPIWRSVFHDRLPLPRFRVIVGDN